MRRAFLLSLVYSLLHQLNKSKLSIMRNLSRFILYFALTLLAGSCAFHTGNITTAPQGADFTHIDQAIGQSKTIKIFGLGGLRRDALVYEARQDLLQNRPLGENEAYANVAVDIKNSFVIIYSATKVTVTADVVRYAVDSSARYASTFPPYALENKDELFRQLYQVGDTVYNKDQKPHIVKGYVQSGLYVYSIAKNQNFIKQLAWDDVYAKPKQLVNKLRNLDQDLLIDTAYNELFSPLDTVLDTKGQSHVIALIDQDEAMLIPLNLVDETSLAIKPEYKSANAIFTLKKKTHKSFKIGQSISFLNEIYYLVAFGSDGVLAVKGVGSYVVVPYDIIK
jgi:hypothetical protein